MHDEKLFSYRSWSCGICEASVHARNKLSHPAYPAESDNALKRLRKTLPDVLPDVCRMLGDIRQLMRVSLPAKAATPQTKKSAG